MSAGTVVVFGGSGFLGRFVVQELREAGLSVRIATRRGSQAAPGVESTRADIRDDASVRAALKDVDAAVNAVSLYVEQRSATFQDIHVEGAARLARECRKAGVRCLVHISGIGIDVASRSPYVRARAQGEGRVRATFPTAIILRPSVLFGPGDAFLCALDRISALSPVIPLIGRGDTLLQAVYAGDVARAVRTVVTASGGIARLYELGGPRSWAYREIIEMVLQHRGRRRWLVPVPMSWWGTAARMLSVLPSPPITRDQLELMRVNNEVHTELPSFDRLGVVPRKLEMLLPECLP